MEDWKARAEAAEALLREPAGDVGEVVRRLNAEEERMGRLFDFVVLQRGKHEGAAFTDINQIKHALSGRDPVLTAAADLLLRQAGEIEKKDAHIEALQSKIDAEKSCACSFDRPGDVCAVHSPLLREAEEVINGLNNLIVQGQKITTETLIGQPRGLSDKAGLNALIGLLDGPEQRKAQGKANAFFAKLSPAPEPVREDTYPDRVSMEPWPYSGHAPGGSDADQ